MIKTVAIVFIAFGFSFSGFCLASMHEKRVEILRETVMMISTMQTQLRYACMPVSDLIRTLDENVKIRNLGFLRVCREKTDSGEAFYSSWRESIESNKELCGLLSGVLPYLIQLGKDLGSTDLEGQLSCCEYYKQIFQKELEERAEQSRKYSKLFPTVGIMLGISAAIIII